MSLLETSKDKILYHEDEMKNFDLELIFDNYLESDLKLYLKGFDLSDDGFLKLVEWYNKDCKKFVNNEIDNSDYMERKWSKNNKRDLINYFADIFGVCECIFLLINIGIIDFNNLKNSLLLN